MANIMDGSGDFCGKDGAAWNKKGSLATNTPVNVVLTNEGVWKVHANVDFYFRGPHSSTNAATTNSQFWVSDDEFLIENKRTGHQVSIMRASANGTYHLNWIRGL